jgi:PAS domain S-box-containing protein
VLAYFGKKDLIKSPVLNIVFFFNVILVIYFQINWKIGDYQLNPGHPPTLYYPNPIAVPFHILFYIVLLTAVGILYKAGIKSADQRRHKQSRIILIALVFTLVFALANIYLPSFIKLKIPLFVDAFYLFPAFALIYSIEKYELYELIPSDLAKNIISLMPAGFILFDTGGNIITSNQSLSSFTGIKRSNFLGKSFRWLNRTLHLSLPAFNSLKEFRKYVDFTRSDGTEISMLVSFSFINNKLGQRTGAVFIFEDITELKFYENKLKGINAELEKKVKERTRELEKSREKAVESDRLKASFLQNMSHEIRTPMNGIMGFSSLLKNPGIEGEKRVKYLDLVIRSSEQLLTIVEDIIKISALETNQEDINIKQVLIKNIFDDLALLYQNKKINTGVDFVISRDNLEGNPRLSTDETKLRQIFINLINNSFKFTKTGSIEIGLKETSGNELQFYVKDTGIGIDPSIHEKIFERFWQCEHGSTRVYGGNGLGLSICKAYVELLGGKIWLDSLPGQGATFYFSIIDTPGNQAEINEVSRETIPDLKGKKILIVEDEPTNFMYLKEVLLPTNIFIEHASNGKIAVEKAVAMNFDLVLMDIKMPVMNGHDATGRIRELDDEVPIIMQTAYNNNTDIDKSFKAGCNDTIVKPINRMRLFALLKKYLG